MDTIKDRNGTDLTEAEDIKKRWQENTEDIKFRKMLMITLYAEQKKRHRCIEQSFRLCGGRRGWDVSREQHRNVYYLG